MTTTVQQTEIAAAGLLDLRAAVAQLESACSDIAWIYPDDIDRCWQQVGLARRFLDDVAPPLLLAFSNGDDGAGARLQNATSGIAKAVRDTATSLGQELSWSGATDRFLAEVLAPTVKTAVNIAAIGVGALFAVYLAGIFARTRGER
jgi:hypothetical protein